MPRQPENAYEDIEIRDDNDVEQNSTDSDKANTNQESSVDNKDSTETGYEVLHIYQNEDV